MQWVRSGWIWHEGEVGIGRRWVWGGGDGCGAERRRWVWDGDGGGEGGDGCGWRGGDGCGVERRRWVWDEDGGGEGGDGCGMEVRQETLWLVECEETEKVVAGRQLRSSRVSQNFGNVLLCADEVG